MPTTVVNGCEIYFEQSGAGPDVVFVHGEDHGIEIFEDQVDALVGDYRCTTYYRRGHGRSQSPPYGYSLWNQTLDLAGLVGSLGIDRAVVVALGMGNPIAVRYALHKPESVSAVVMVAWYELEGYPVLEERRRGVHPMTFDRLHMLMHEVHVKEGAVGLRRFVEENSETFFPIYPLDPAARRKIIDMVCSHPVGHFLQAAEHYTSLPNLVPEMVRISCPVVAICGTDDPTPDRPELLGSLPVFEQLWIEGSRRFPTIEQPDIFNEALLEFLVRSKIN